MEEIVEKCKNTNSSIEKQAILADCGKRHPKLKDLLFRTYEPFIMYHMQAAVKLKDFGRRGATEMWDEFTLLLDLMAKSATPTENRKMLIAFLIRCTQDTQELFLGVVKKKLKLGFGIKQINKVFPKLITTFDVMLAGRYSRSKKYSPKFWRASAKMDGLRLVSLYGFPNKHWNILSRTGKDLTSRLPHLLPDLETFRKKFGFTFLDGEAYLHGTKFEQIQGDVMRSGGDNCDYIEYHVFAFGDVDSFLNQSIKCMTIPSNEKVTAGKVITVPHFEIPNEHSRMEQFALKMEEKGYEGAMFRNPVVPYFHGRSDNLVKLKSWLLDDAMQDLSFKCTGITSSIQRRPDKITKGMIDVKTMKAIVAEDPATKVITKVGSGFSHEQRDEIWKNKEKYIGKMLDLKYQKIGSGGAGIFPVFQRWRLEF